jgi:aminoglycoside phosphotransferase (APT) family kinase protein
MTARRGLPAAALQRVCDALAPGGRVLRYRPLRGGVSSSVHLVHHATPDGARQAVVVRRYGQESQAIDPGAAAREFRLLDLLAQYDVPAPRPLLLEAEGGPFGAPTIVLSRLPGRPRLVPGVLGDYLRQLAGTLARLHALPTDGLDFLPDQRDLVSASLARHYVGSDPLQEAIGRMVVARWPAVAAAQSRHALLHGDYWPGNTLWVRGRLVGLVDWEQPRLGGPAKDVATCRGDLTLLLGSQAGDAFVAAYEAAAGYPVTNLAFWDAYVCTWALTEVAEWLPGWQALGRRDLSLETARQRVRGFAEAALARAD